MFTYPLKPCQNSYISYDVFLAFVPTNPFVECHKICICSYKAPQRLLLGLKGLAKQRVHTNPHRSDKKGGHNPSKPSRIINMI